MNSKAIKRQLLAAIAMVLVAAIALGSSTYAWFASNNVVKAEGMSVSAQTEGSLLVISTSTTLGTQTTVTMNITGTELYPTHLNTADKAAFTATSAWSHSFSEKFDTAITDKDREENLSLNSGETSKYVYRHDANSGDVKKQSTDQYYDTDGKQYFLAGKMYIGLNDQNDKAECGVISLDSFTIASTGGSNLAPSVRVALVPLDTNSTESGNTELKGKLAGIVAPDSKKVTTRTDKSVADTLVSYTAGDIKISGANLAKGEYIELGVYIYFDGRDASCTSANFDTTETAVTLTFKAADPA